MHLRTPTLEDLYKVADWRNATEGVLRTHGDTTYEQQERFFKEVIQNSNSPHRYFAIYDSKCHNDDGNCMGLGGLTNVDWINGNAEISLILDPSEHGKGYGAEAVKLLLNVAFKKMRLENVYGECYSCNDNLGFWENIVEKYSGFDTTLPARKFHNGNMYSSMWFNIGREGFDCHK